MGTYFEVADPRALVRLYPLGRDFRQRYGRMSIDELRSIQERRFGDTISLGWRTPFYRRQWGRHGIEPGDIRTLEDLHLLPLIDKADIMQAVTLHPPFGDFAPSGANDSSLPRIIHTTSGTTGRPQPVMFGPRSREIQNILLARTLLEQGINETDVIHSVYGFGLVNGGHYFREAVTHYTSATLIPAGTGNDVRSELQVELMSTFRVTVLAGFGDYLRKLGSIARERRLRDAIPIRMLTGHFSPEAKGLVEAEWGVPAFDWYGVADTGVVAAESQNRNGLYVWEDAHIVEVAASESGEPVDDGELGALVVTCLYKDDIYPIIRFNTHDLSAVRSTAMTGSIPFRRIAGFLGRSDNMVKLRGIGVYPDAIGAILGGDGSLTGEYVCVARRRAGAVDDVTVLIESREPSVGAEHYAQLLRDRLGVRLTVSLVLPGETNELTGLGTRQKPRRLVYSDV